MNFPYPSKCRIQDLSLVDETLPLPCTASHNIRQYSQIISKSSNENLAFVFSRPFCQKACQLFAEMGSMTLFGSVEIGNTIASRIRNEVMLRMYSMTGGGG